MMFQCHVPAGLNRGPPIIIHFAQSFSFMCGSILGEHLATQGSKQFALLKDNNVTVAAYLNCLLVFALSYLLSKVTRVSVFFRVYSDRTRQRLNDGVKHNALDLEHMLVNRGAIGRAAASNNLYNSDAVVLTLARPVWIDP